MTKGRDFAMAVLDMADAIAREYEQTGLADGGEIKSAVIAQAYEERKRLEVTLRESPPLFRHRLRQYARMHYRDERVREFARSGGYLYDPQYVRKFLPYSFALEDWSDGPPPEDACSEWPTGEAWDTALDIRRAFRHLRPWQQRIIYARHLSASVDGGEVDWPEVARLTGRGSARAAEVAYNRATDILTAEMNLSRAERESEHEGLGSRRAVSNATVRARLADSY